MKKIPMPRGINHNMFGKRDLVQYGTETPPDIDQALETLGTELGVRITSPAAH
jgi:3-dehydroquinate dehydratase-2